MTGRMTASLLWMLIIALAAAGPGAGGVPTSREAAEPWVVRADREIAAVTEPTEDYLDKLSGCRLAMWAYEASPSDARRKAAAGRIRSHCAIVASLPVTGGGHRSQQQSQLDDYDAAACMAEVDYLDGASEFIAAATRPTNRATMPDSPDRTDAISDMALPRAFALIRLGRGDEVDDVPCSPAEAQFYIWRFDDAGHPEMGDTLSGLIHLPRNLEAKQESATRQLVLEMNGYFREALVVAEGVDDPLDRCTRVVIAGGWAAAHGRADLLPRVRADASKCAEYRQNVPMMRENMAYLMETCAEAGDRAGVDETIAWFDRGWPNEEPKTKIAAAAAAVGEMELCKSRIQSARADAAETVNPDERRSLYLGIAVASARAGDSSRVNSALASAAQAAAGVDGDPDCNNRALAAVAAAYARAGHLDDAIAFLPKIGGSPVVEARRVVAHALTVQGRFDVARKVVRGLEPRERARSLCFIATQQVKQNKTDGLADWIDKVPTAAERAVIDLAVAKAISGRPNRWFDRMMSDE